MNTSRLQANPRYFWALLGLMVVSLIAYVFLVQGSLYYALSSNAMSSLLQTRESELAILEGRHYAITGELDVNLAHKLGFVDSEHALFVSLESPGDLVGYANEGAR